MKKLIQQSCTLLTFLLFMWHGSTVIAQCNHPDDYTALRALYLATDGDNWTINTGWPTRAQFLANPTPPVGTDMSGWYGITCENDRVICLDMDGTPDCSYTILLNSNNLTGEIPDEIEKLSYIKYINLNFNKLTGEIPVSLAKLTYLQSLIISNNLLHGIIPNELGSLNNLKILDFGYNKLSGFIPFQLGMLNNLTTFNLISNQLTGVIPKELANLTKLQYFDLSENQLTGSIPLELGLFNNLYTLNLQSNQLTGGIPKGLGNLSKLLSLDLSDNQLTGSIPLELGFLDNLSALSLQSNQLIGEIPTELGNLNNLQNLLLSENQLSGNIPKEIGKLNKLKYLWLNSNQLSGSIPKELGNLINLQSIFLSNNRLSGCLDLNLRLFCSLGPFNNQSVERYFFSKNPLLPWKGDFSQFCATDGSQQAQIGAPCDNGNPADGTNDVIQDDCSCGLLPPCNHPDFAPLLALYNSTTGPDWTNKTGWEDGAAGINCDPCNFNGQPWYGIRCISGRVESIDLRNNNLSGFLPKGDTLAGLDFLKSLFLSINNISEEIPSGIGNIKNIETIEINRNLLTGSIPENLGNAKNLRYINLRNNNLTGEIPDSLMNLPNLYFLDLRSNNLTGEIPESINRLLKLSIIDLYDNRLSGNIPTEIGEIKTLGKINFGNNKLSGVIPTGIGTLNNLVSLSLENNDLNGEIPNNIGNLVNLNWLALSGNKLTGSIPISIGGLVDSCFILLRYNNLSNCFPGILKKFCGKNFDSNSNPLLPWQGDFSKFCATDGSQQAQIGAPCNNGNLADGTNDVIQDDCSCGLLPPCNHPDFAPLLALYNSTNGPGWTNKTGWEAGALGTNCDPCNGWYGIECQNGRVNKLKLPYNNLFGIIPKEIGNLSNLTVLYLNNNKLTGRIPTEVGNLFNLTGLNLSDNELTDIIPKELGNLTNLMVLFLNNNKLTGNLPNEFGNLSSLMVLFLNNNKLSGSIPIEVGNLSNLIMMFLNNNQLTGSIPNDFSKLSNLLKLYLSDNQLTGAIPKELGSLVKLGELHLYNNQLSGIIPKEIGNLSNLVELYLNNNQLTGSLAKELGNLSEMRTLNLSLNQLSGELPKEFVNLKKITEIFLNNNQFSGCIDPSLKLFCRDSIIIETSPGIFINLEMIVNFSNNPLLPWQGDFSQFCATDGSQQAQVGAPCNNGNPADGTNDVIDQNCNCVPCTTSFATITGINAVCQGGSATFTAVGGTSYLWSNGATTADITVNTAGIYSVTVTNANGCVAKGERTLTINANPTAVIAGANSTCVGSTTTITASGGIGYDWSTGENTNGIDVGPGTYTVTVSNVSGCTGTTQKTISTSPSLTAVIVGANSTCSGSTTLLTASGGTGYEWSTGDITSSIDVGPGTYTVTVSDGSGCTGTTKKTISSSPSLTAVIAGANSVCVGSTTTITASGGTYYEWSSGENTSSIDVGSGTYTVTVSDASGCTGTNQKVIITYPSLTAVIAGNNSTCSGSTTTLIASGGTDYEWSTGENTSSIEVGPGTYTVTVSNASGCTGTTQKVITTSPKLTAVIAGANSVCVGSTTTLTASGGTSYLWNTGATSKAIQINSGGIYTISVTNDNGCAGSTSFRVTLLDDTTLSQTKNDTLYVDQGSSYQVDLLQNDILFTDSIKVQLVNIPQAFIRVLSFDEKGRISLEVKEAFIETLEIGYEVCDPCNPCVSGKLIILNEKLKEITQTTLMTPLQSTNNTLQFSSEPIPDSELWIYNRWGQQIFHSKNYQNDWDANGYPGGVYYYVFTVYGFTIKRALTVVK